MSVTEPGLQRLRMSWEDYLALPDDVRAEWVDGEVFVSPRPALVHGRIVARMASVLLVALPGADVVTGSGVRLPGNRLRGPDVMVLDTALTTTWAEEPPLVVVEVLSPSTRSEDTVRKPGEYAAGGVGQLWIVDPEHLTIDVYTLRDGQWHLLLHLDQQHPTGEVQLGDHGTVPLDLAEVMAG